MVLVVVAEIGEQEIEMGEVEDVCAMRVIGTNHMQYNKTKHKMR